MQDTGYKIRNQQAIHFLTFSVVNWVGIFSRQIYRDILLDNLSYCQKEKSLIIYAYVIMSNHVHILVKSETGNLSNTIRDFKSYTTKKLIETIKEYPESRREWILWIACPESSGFERAAKKHKRNSKYQI
jgi:REP element-mobilizing transposase RayT